MRDWRSSLQSKSMRNVVLGMCAVNVIATYGAYRHLDDEIVLAPFAAPAPVQASYSDSDFSFSAGLPHAGLQAKADLDIPSLPADRSLALASKPQVAAMTDVAVAPAVPKVSHDVASHPVRSVRLLAIVAPPADAGRTSSAFLKEFAAPGGLSPLPADSPDFAPVESPEMTPASMPSDVTTVEPAMPNAPDGESDGIADNSLPPSPDFAPPEQPKSGELLLLPIANAVVVTPPA